MDGLRPHQVSKFNSVRRSVFIPSSPNVKIENLDIFSLWLSIISRCEGVLFVSLVELRVEVERRRGVDDGTSGGNLEGEGHRSPGKTSRTVVRDQKVRKETMEDGKVSSERDE